MNKVIRHFFIACLLMHCSLLFASTQQLFDDSVSSSDVDTPSSKSPYVSNSYPVDISFPTIDIKYNKENGVQILEFNTGIRSGYKGSAFVNDDPYSVGKHFVDTLLQYQNEVWYYSHHISSHILKRVFSDSKFNTLNRCIDPLDDKIFRKAAYGKILDPQNIHDYHGMYLGNSKSVEEIDQFRKDYPGIIPLNAALLKFRASKGKLNSFFTSHESLKRYKPQCAVYPKAYHPELAQTILEEISSETVVLKPVSSTRGRGVIIVHQDDLDETLEYIFSGSEQLSEDPDISYRWWAGDTSGEFVVEEFVPSDTIYVPHLDNRPFDGTMRVVLVMTYSNQEITIHFLDKYWKLPRRSLDEEGSLNLKHKSKAQRNYFAPVSDEIWEEVESQLRDALTSLYAITLFEG